MKHFVISAALALLTATSQAATSHPPTSQRLTNQVATLTAVQVGAPAIDCIFSPSCTALVQESSSPIALPGTAGTGLLLTRVIQGEAGFAADGLFGYEYRIDLSSVSLGTNGPPCFTNTVRCFTNRVEYFTNVLVCRTNVMRLPNVVLCVTNIIPATNFVSSFTNSFPETNAQQCFTDATGNPFCVTNTFPATNYVTWLTNRVPQKKIISCQTISGPVTNYVVTCATNRIRAFSNVVTCITNTISCPGSPPCIGELRVNFGSIATNLDFDTNGVADQVYVVSTGGLGTVAPSLIAQVKGQIVFQFSPPLCPGDSSYAVGLVSAGTPQDVPATLNLTSTSNLVVAARGPKPSPFAKCDFTALQNKIAQLGPQDILGTDDTVRETRRTNLLNQVSAAATAARAGDLDAVLTDLAAIITRTDGGANDWLTRNAAHQVNQVTADLLDCLEHADKHKGDHDDDDDD